MHIGVLITRFPPEFVGGAELQSKQLARELAKRGHKVTVFTRRAKGRRFIEQEDGYEVCRRNELPIPGLRMFWDVFPAAWHIARRRPRPQVLLCYQTFNSGLIGIVAQTLLRIPAIVSVRGNREYRLSDSFLNRLLVPGIYRRACRIVLQSPAMLDDLMAQFRLAGRKSLVNSLQAKTAVIPNGIPLNGYEPPRGNKVLFVGRLIRNKGVADLLEALRRIPAAEATIVGDGPDRARLEELAVGLPVEFAGQACPDQINEYLRQSRLLVLPSRLGDGMPNVILEAMAAGLPVIASCTAGIPDVVRDEVNGLLFNPGDVEQLATHITRLLKDRSLAREMGRRGRELVEFYSWDAVVPRVEQLLHDTAGPTPDG